MICPMTKHACGAIFCALFPKDEESIFTFFFFWCLNGRKNHGELMKFLVSAIYMLIYHLCRWNSLKSLEGLNRRANRERILKTPFLSHEYLWIYYKFLISHSHLDIHWGQVVEIISATKLVSTFSKLSCRGPPWCMSINEGDRKVLLWIIYGPNVGYDLTNITIDLRFTKFNLLCISFVKL